MNKEFFETHLFEKLLIAVRTGGNKPKMLENFSLNNCK